MRMNPTNTDIKILLDAVINRMEKNELENKKISKTLIVVKEELKDINEELNILCDGFQNESSIGDIEYKKFKVLTQLNKLEEWDLLEDDESFDIDFLDDIVGES
jgi:hypothetical protein